MIFTINQSFAAENNTTAGTTTVSTVSSVQETSMGFANVLNILLITIGIVIILLAVAILVKLNK